jgi:hypothetical protein
VKYGVVFPQTEFGNDPQAIAVDTMRAGFPSPQAHIEAIRSFREVLG